MSQWQLTQHKHLHWQPSSWKTVLYLVNLPKRSMNLLHHDVTYRSCLLTVPAALVFHQPGLFCQNTAAVDIKLLIIFHSTHTRNCVESYGGCCTAQNCAVIILIYHMYSHSITRTYSTHPTKKTGWSHARVLHGPEGSAVVSLNIYHMPLKAACTSLIMHASVCC